MKKYKVTFLPSGKTTEGFEGETILDIAIRNNIPLKHACGGNLGCATCHIIIKEGSKFLSEKTQQEEDRLYDANGVTLNSRLGCQAKIYGDLVVLIPQ